jgi:methylthioribulose 1-phosphate dehydratase / enolase-phosphatase E1
VQVEEDSYHEIALALGVDDPSEIMFATDNILEAQAAAAAGWGVVLALRPGNHPLPSDTKLRMIHSMNELLP